MSGPPDQAPRDPAVERMLAVLRVHVHRHRLMAVEVEAIGVELSNKWITAARAQELLDSLYGAAAEAGT